ncbi:MAG: nucleotidyltransferase family protein [Terriglobales bacterium]
MHPYFPPELELVLSCACVGPDSGAIERQQRACAAVRNWDAALTSVSRHSVTPLVFQNLTRHCSEAIPAPILSELRDRAEANTVRNLRLTRALLELLDRLQDAGISAIPYKGPTLAVTAYGDISLREFVDLDLLVPGADMLRARDVLLADGWTPEYRMTAQQGTSYLRHACEYNFYREDTALELHWQIAPPHMSVAFHMDGLWQRARSIQISGRHVPVLCNEDLLLVLAVHGAKHLWSSVRWLCDVAQTGRTATSLDWDAICVRARQIGAARILHVALHLAHTLLGATIPRRVLADADSTVPRICTRLMRNLVGPPRRTPLRDHFAAVHMREHWRDRVRYVWRVGKAPGPLVEAGGHTRPRSRFVRLLNYFAVRG